VNDVCAVTVFRLKIQFRGKKSIAEMYTAVEYIEMIVICGECGGNARETARVYRERFPNRNRHPDHKTILHAIARGRETGQVVLCSFMFNVLKQKNLI
jgi:hypothetical protein